MQERAIQPCPKCNQNRVTTVFAGREAALIQPKRDPGWLGHNQSMIDAITCTNCGYTELYAHDPAKLIPDNPG